MALHTGHSARIKKEVTFQLNFFKKILSLVCFSRPSNKKCLKRRIVILLKDEDDYIEPSRVERTRFFLFRSFGGY